jgi:hypothetical protein
MPYLAVLAAVALILPALALGAVALVLTGVAGLAVVLAALTLGAAGTLMDWILTALALAAGWRAVELGRRLLERVRTAWAE